MIAIKEYVRPQSIQEAYERNQKNGSRILGGMLWLKLGGGAAATAIDLSGLGLDAIEESETEFSIGAMTSLRQLETHPGLNAYTCGAAARALESIVGVQFRNLATVGGSLFGRFGFSDVLTLFLALDTAVELYHGGMVPLEAFAAQKPDRDLLIRVHVRKTPGVFGYLSMRNSRTDFPVLSCAVSRLGGEYRTVLGARPGRAMVLRDGEGLLAGGIDGTSAQAFGAWAADHTPTGSNTRGSAAYRTHLVRVLTERGLLELGGMDHGA
ncbi:MAG: xanthine dehydrogenase [Oscillospiraceae bacterium]|nr:xanthine dehydrogenase [Oscillospiraceae bacterium]